MKKVLLFLTTILFAANLFAQRTITVTGAGTPGVNTVYTEDGVLNGRPQFFSCGDADCWPTGYRICMHPSGKWVIQITGLVLYEITSSDELPPRTGWEVADGISPAPTLSGDGSLPVELSSFSVYAENNVVIITWTTESEVDNLGFILDRSEGNSEFWEESASYRTHEALKGQGNTSSRTEYTFTDITVEASQSYYYRLSDVSVHGDITTYPPIFIQLVDPPKETLLEKAYPNPFNPKTYIAYHLAEATQVKITVFNMLGRSVKELHDGRQPAGSYHIYWNGTNENGMKAPSGTYTIRMQTEKETQIQKVMFIK